MDAEGAVEQELREEAGIDIRSQKGWTMRSLGTCVPSKFLDHVYNLFCINVTDMQLPDDVLRGAGDGSDGEAGAFCRWEYPHVVLGCKCPLVVVMAMRAGLLSRI